MGIAIVKPVRYDAAVFRLADAKYVYSKLDTKNNVIMVNDLC